MAKLVLNNITSGFASTTATNANNDLVETAIENTLSRDGTSPNQMEANLDMNGYAILNQRATSGNENFIWSGTWVTGTTYAVNNLVYAPEGSNEGATLICVTAHPAGATLDGDSANWAVFAQRGASGAGTGDVVGPASATADSLVRFNGTTGKLIKDGAVIGTHVQAYSAKTASYVANTLTAANKIPYASALNTAAELDFLDEDTLVSDSATAIPSQQSVKAYVDAASASTLGTKKITTSGTSIDFTGIASTAKNIVVNFDLVSTGGTSSYLIQLGSSGLPKTSGYNGCGVRFSGTLLQTGASSAGAIFPISTAPASVSGSVFIALLDSNTWCITGTLSDTAATATFITSSSVTLAGVLDIVRITTVSGDSFDAGQINILVG